MFCNGNLNDFYFIFINWKYVAKILGIWNDITENKKYNVSCHWTPAPAVVSQSIFFYPTDSLHS